MKINNLLIVKPELRDVINTVSKEHIVLFNDIKIIVDISDKSYKDKVISSAFIELVKSTHIHDYVTKHYISDNYSMQLNLYLDLSLILKNNDFGSKDELYTYISKSVSEYFSSYIQDDKIIDRKFADSIGVEPEKGMKDLEFITLVYSMIIYNIFIDNLYLHSVLFEIIGDGITKGDSKDDIIFRIKNLIENYEQNTDIH